MISTRPSVTEDEEFERPSILNEMSLLPHRESFSSTMSVDPKEVRAQGNFSLNFWIQQELIILLFL